MGVPDDLAGRALLGIDGTPTIPARVSPAPRRSRRLPVRAVGRVVSVQARTLLNLHDVHEATPAELHTGRIGQRLVNVAALEAVDRTPAMTRGRDLRGFIDLPGGTREVLLSQVSLSLPRIPAWLRDVFRLISTRPGYQLDISQDPGTTLTASEFAHLVGGLRQILSQPRPVPPERVPPGRHPGTIDIDAPVLLAGSLASAVPARSRRNLETLDDLAPRDPQPQTPHPPPRAGQTETELVEDAMATLKQLLNSTTIADLAIHGKQCC